MEAICRDLSDYSDLAAEHAALTEQFERVREAVAMERRCLEDSLDADAWIGYAAPLASVARIARGMAIVQRVIAEGGGG
jgi:hypothetical protein